MSGVLVVGAGGHAKVVIATLQACGIQVAGVLDDRPDLLDARVLGVPVVGNVHKLERGGRAVVAVGNNRTRADIQARFPQVEWVPVIHPAAYVHPSARIGAGSVVFAGAVVQPDARLGCHVIVNTGATVDHDCVLEHYVHVAPGSHLAGNVQLDEGAFLGVGGCVAPSVRIGAWSLVGAGGVVVRDIPAGVTAVGVPARPKGEQR